MGDLSKDESAYEGGARPRLPPLLPLSIVVFVDAPAGGERPNAFEVKSGEGERKGDGLLLAGDGGLPLVSQSIFVM
jgi:hypothetical protein